MFKDYKIIIADSVRQRMKSRHAYKAHRGIGIAIGLVSDFVRIVTNGVLLCEWSLQSSRDKEAVRQYGLKWFDGNHLECNVLCEAFEKAYSITAHVETESDGKIHVTFSFYYRNNREKPFQRIWGDFDKEGLGLLGFWEPH